MAVCLAACASSPRPIEITYPHEDVDYSGFRNLLDLTQQVLPFYVKVIVYNDAEPSGIAGAASGVMLDQAGHIVTAAHIVKHARYRAFVGTVNGSILPANIIHVDPDNELALLRIAIKYQASAAPDYVNVVSPGQKVFAIGTQPARSAIVTVGSIRFVRLRKWFRHGKYSFKDPVALSMPVTPGYSGGPVFDENGRLVGMLVGFDWGRDDNGKPVQVGDAYAISASRIFEYYEKWK